MNGNAVPNGQLFFNNLPSGNYQFSFRRNEPKEKDELAFKLTGNDSAAIYVNSINGRITTTLFKIKRNEENYSSVAKDSMVFYVVEQMPVFIGGDIELRKYISNSVEQTIANTDSIQKGRVFVCFVVDEQGKIDEVRVVRSNNQKLDNFANEIIRAMPDWIPGKQAGKPARVSFTVPINF